MSRTTLVTRAVPYLFIGIYFAGGVGVSWVMVELLHPLAALGVFFGYVALTITCSWLLHDYWLMPRWQLEAVQEDWPTFYAALQAEISEVNDLIDYPATDRRLG